MKNFIIKLITKHSFIIFVAVLSLTLFQGKLEAAAGLQNQSTYLNRSSSGLVGYWTFDGKDILNGVILDRSGSGNNGNTVNIASSTFYSVGKLGQAATFTSSSYVSVSNLDRNTLSSCAWMYSTSLANSQVIVDTLATGGWGFYVTTAGKLSLTKRGSTEVLSTGVTTVNTWHHLCVTYDGSNARFYIDGALDSSPAYSNTFSNGGATGYGIGGFDVAGNNTNGRLDDVRVYNRVLSLTEIKMLYSLGNFTVQTSRTSRSTDSLIGMWSFDGKDISNGVVLDRSGNGRNLLLYNIATSTFYTTGRVGQAVNLTTSSDYAESNAATWGITSTYSMSAWVKTTSASAAAVVSLGRFQVTDEPMIYLTPTNASFYVSCGSGCYTGVVGTATTINDGKWHHIVVTSTATACGSMLLYVDGALEANTCSTGGLHTAPSDSSRNFFVGWRSWNNAPTYSEKLVGRVDNARLYSKALSAAEVLALYKAEGGSVFNVSQNTKLTTGLVGLWSFDGADLNSTTAYDRSGNGFNATLNSFSSATSSKVVGKVGQALTFPGGATASYVSTNSNDIMAVPTGLTIAFWMKATTTATSTSRLFSVEGVYMVSETTAGKLQGIVDGAEVDYAQTSGIVDGKWHHIAFTHTGAVSGGTIYVDGVASSTFTSGASYSGFYNIGSISRPTAIGGNVSPNPVAAFGGFLDDVRLYNRVLSTSEITRLYSIGK